MLAVAVLAVALAGCSITAPAPVGPAIGPALTSPAAAEAMPILAPAAVTIPSIGITDSPLQGLGLAADGTLAVPPVTEPGQVSYYDAGVLPGEVGPALLAGHVSGTRDGASVPGVFARLDELASGDEIFTVDVAGGERRWVVQRSVVYPKDAVDWVETAGDTAGPEIRLITCEGTLRTLAGGERSYDSNLVVHAVLA